jgi:hypothetical protein
MVTRCARGCSALCKEDGSFAPAHMLADARLERAGRAAPPGGGLDRRRSDPGGGGRAGATRTAALVRAPAAPAASRIEAREAGLPVPDGGVGMQAGCALDLLRHAWRICCGCRCMVQRELMALWRPGHAGGG